MNEHEKMTQLFEVMADATKEKIEKEKETNLSEDTYRMISLTQSLYNSINCFNKTPFLKDNGINPFSID